VTNNGCERAAVQEASDITKFFKKKLDDWSGQKLKQTPGM